MNMVVHSKELKLITEHYTTLLSEFGFLLQGM